MPAPFKIPSMDKNVTMTRPPLAAEPGFSSNSTLPSLYTPSTLVIILETSPNGSSKQRRNRLRLDQFARLVEVIVNDRMRINAKRVIHRRQDLNRMHRILSRRRTRRVRFPVQRAAPDAGTRYARCVAIRPMIPSIGRLAVA